MQSTVAPLEHVPPYNYFALAFRLRRATVAQQAVRYAHLRSKGCDCTPPGLAFRRQMHRVAVSPLRNATLGIEPRPTDLQSDVRPTLIAGCMSARIGPPGFEPGPSGSEPDVLKSLQAAPQAKRAESQLRREGGPSTALLCETGRVKSKLSEQSNGTAQSQMSCRWTMGHRHPGS